MKLLLSALFFLLLQGIQSNLSANDWKNFDKRLQYIYNRKPEFRWGVVNGDFILTYFTGMEGFRRYHYGGSVKEKICLLYTCRGGQIDGAHLRDFIDVTAYYYAKIRWHLHNEEGSFGFSIVHPKTSLFALIPASKDSWIYVDLVYPDDWETFPEEAKEDIKHFVSLSMAQYLAYMTGLWHEMMTWLGFQTCFLISEYASAFSWEDIYSDLVGITIAGNALTDMYFDKTLLIDSTVEKHIVAELEALDPQSAGVGRLSRRLVRNRWHGFNLASPLIPKIWMRNFDIGMDDGLVTPTLIPGITSCKDAKPKSYFVPALTDLWMYDFNVSFRLLPREWQWKKVLNIVYPDRKERKRWIIPSEHFPIILNKIKEEAKRRGQIIQE